jgi:hypothetical protein
MSQSRGPFVHACDTGEGGDFGTLKILNLIYQKGLNLMFYVPYFQPLWGKTRMLIMPHIYGYEIAVLWDGQDGQAVGDLPFLLPSAWLLGATVQ